MLNKKMIILIILASVFLITMLGIFSFIDKKNKQKMEKETISKNNNFISLWATYDYNSFNSQPQKVKDFVTEELYNKNFGDEMSLALREGRLISKEYAVKTSPIKTISVKKEKDSYIIITEVLEKVTSKEEKYEEQKNIKITWNSQGKASDIEYLE